MPRTDPPPPKKHGSPKGGGVAGRSSRPPASGPQSGKARASSSEKPPQPIDEVEITVDEVEITLSDAELSDSQVSGWMSSEPSEHDRVTVAPPMPEDEYVAKMMKQLPDVERIPPSRAITPIRGLAGLRDDPRKSAPPASHARGSTRNLKAMSDAPPKATSSRTSGRPASPRSVSPKHAEPTQPLTLDLSDSLLPVAVPSPVPLPTFEKSSVPKFDAVESAPAPATGARNTLPSARNSGAAGVLAVADASAPLRNSSEPARFSFGPAAGDALELVGVRAESVKPELETTTMVEVRDRFEVGDFSGALALASKILEADPEHTDALLYAEHCRDVLKQMYISNLGGLRRVPQLAVSPEQLRWLALDHRAGFLLSLLDGRSTFEELLDVCGMAPFDAIRLLVQLLQQNVIRVV